MMPRLRLSFAEAAEFREEYARNIVKGGAFIHTTDEFEARDLVAIELDLGFCGESVVLEAEIVHFLSAEQAGSEAAAGVAVQFLEPAPVLRDSLQRFTVVSELTESDFPEPASRELPGGSDTSLAERGAAVEEGPLEEERDASLFDPSEVDLAQNAEASGEEDEDPLAAAVERRKAPRIRTRVPARVDATSMSLEGRTRDLSESGVLVSADGSDLPVGKAVKLELTHPVSGDRLEVEGNVSRHIEAEGTVAAVGIEFGEDPVGGELSAFVEEVNRAEQELQRTGIYGEIEELGVVVLLRMLGTTAKQGTLTIVSGVEEGSLDFENGVLRHAELGDLRGTKALSRFLSWDQGRFEFHARLGAADGEPVDIPLEEAIAEAIRHHGNLIQAELTGVLEPAARFAIDAETLLGEGSLTRTQEAVLDLVAANLSVRRILDVIPQPDAEVIEALKSLLQEGVIRPA